MTIVRGNGGLVQLDYGVVICKALIGGPSMGRPESGVDDSQLSRVQAKLIVQDWAKKVCKRKKRKKREDFLGTKAAGSQI